MTFQQRKQRRIAQQQGGRIRIRVMCWCGRIIEVSAVPHFKPACDRLACQQQQDLALQAQHTFDEAWRAAQLAAAASKSQEKRIALMQGQEIS